MIRDRSRSPPAKLHAGNGTLPLNIKEEDNESSPTKDTSPAPNANLLAANYFANNHLKLAENLINHGGANFLHANLLQSNKSNHNEIRTSPEKNHDDDVGMHHPMGGYERKDFDFSKVNGECGSTNLLSSGIT